MIRIEALYRGSRGWWEPREAVVPSKELYITFLRLSTAMEKVLSFDRRYLAEVESYRVRIGSKTLFEFPVAKP